MEYFWQKIITKTLKLNPDGDFLFMKDGQPIYADSFNEHLKNKVCKPLNIPYRSSHQIRFTITTMLYEAGVPLNQLSTCWDTLKRALRYIIFGSSLLIQNQAQLWLILWTRIFQTAIQLIHNKKSPAQIVKNNEQGKKV